jgi:hypothetical protein
LLLCIGAASMFMNCIIHFVNLVGHHRHIHAITPQHQATDSPPSMEPTPNVKETEITILPEEDACIGRSSNDQIVVIINPFYSDMITTSLPSPPHP